MGVVNVRTFVTVESEINCVYVWANSHDMFCIYESLTRAESLESSNFTLKMKREFAFQSVSDTSIAFYVPYLPYKA